MTNNNKLESKIEIGNSQSSVSAHKTEETSSVSKAFENKVEQEKQDDNNKHEKQKSKKKLILIVAGTVVLVALIVVGIIVVNNQLEAQRQEAEVQDSIAKVSVSAIKTGGTTESIGYNDLFDKLIGERANGTSPSEIFSKNQDLFNSKYDITAYVERISKTTTNGKTSIEIYLGQPRSDKYYVIKNVEDGRCSTGDLVKVSGCELYSVNNNLVFLRNPKSIEVIEAASK